MRLDATGVAVEGRLRATSLSLEPGRVLVVVGPNGAGKSTLVATCLGLLSPSEGRVELDGAEVHRLRPRERAAGLGWLPQRGAPATGLTVLEVVAAARFRFREGRASSEARARAVLQEDGLQALVGRRMASLSGGERQRVRLAALTAQEARLWLLDEPGSHLDPAARLALWGRLHCEAVGERGVLVVSHDVGMLAHLPPDRTDVLGLGPGGGFTLGLDDDRLAEALGELLGLRLERLVVGDAVHLVPGGPR